MAKHKQIEEPAHNPTVQERLRAGGCNVLWTAQPRNQPFTVECWMTAARRLIIIQVYHSGPVNTFEEVTTAQLEDILQTPLAR